MGLYRRGNVYWMDFVHNHVRYQRSTNTSDRKTAEKIYAIIKAKIALNQWIPEEELQERQEYTFSDLVEKYRAWAKGRLKTYTQNDKGSRYYTVNKLERKFGQFRLSDITTAAIEAYQSELLNQGLQAGGVNRIVNVLKAMMTKACDWNMISENELRQVRKVKPIRGERNRLRYLSQEEITRLIDCCDPTIKPIVITALSTGMRRGEIKKLRWDDIDLKHQVILISDTTTKTGEKREIPLSTVLAQTLSGMVRRIDTPFVFPSEAWTNFRKRFDTALRKAGIKDFHFHDLRHTFASQMVMAGVDIATVSKLLGHKSLKMTLRYAHLSPGHLKEAAKKIDIFLTPEMTVLRAKTG